MGFQGDIFFVLKLEGWYGQVVVKMEGWYGQDVLKICQLPALVTPPFSVTLFFLKLSIQFNQKKDCPWQDSIWGWWITSPKPYPLSYTESVEIFFFNTLFVSNKSNLIRKNLLPMTRFNLRLMDYKPRPYPLSHTDSVEIFFFNTLFVSNKIMKRGNSPKKYKKTTTKSGNNISKCQQNRSLFFFIFLCAF